MVKYLLLLISFSSIHSASFIMEDLSVFTGIRISSDRLYIKSFWVHRSEIKNQEDIKSSGEIYQIKLFDGTLLTGTVERHDNYIIIGSNPVFKDSRKIMKADIVSLTEIKRTQVRTYLGYVIIGVIENENDDVIYMTNVYNPEGYILKSKVQAEADIPYDLKSYGALVKDRQHIRPWKQYSFYGYFSYTYSHDDSIKEYLPSIFGSTLGVIRGADDWFRMSKRYWYIPVLGTFLHTQYYSTDTAYYLTSFITAGLYWKARTFYRITMHFGVSPGLAYFRVCDLVCINSVSFVQMFSVLLDIRLYKNVSLALRGDESVIFEAGKAVLYPHFSAGVKYEI